jgi:hypothetical protein
MKVMNGRQKYSTIDMKGELEVYQSYTQQAPPFSEACERINPDEKLSKNLN